MALPLRLTLNSNFRRLFTNQRSIYRYLNTVKGADQKTRVFSGIQPTGIPHIGNYLGAIQHWVRLQDEYEDVMFSVVDLHSYTVPQDPQVHRKNIFDMVICLLACGIDPHKHILFQQSTVPEHSELCWILTCLCTMAKVKELPLWKEKSSTEQKVGMGIFSYPLLMSADILLYKATHVPVGDDQLKHIKLTQNLAGIFNNKYKEKFFPKPKGVVGEFSRIKSLNNPDNKMSKSDSADKSRINLTDTPDDITLKIQKAMSDFTSQITYDPVNRPSIANLLEIHSGFTGKTPEEICEECDLMNTLQYKHHLAEVVIECLKPIQQEIEKLNNDKQYVRQVMKLGHRRAREIATDNMDKVKKIIGVL